MRNGLDVPMARLLFVGAVSLSTVGSASAGPDGQIGNAMTYPEHVHDPNYGADDDAVCSHGVALDVHCCGCHSGFLFDPDSCICLAIEDLRTEYPGLSIDELRDRCRQDDDGWNDAEGWE